jgi:putative GTP pyrophosphokinase
MNISELETEYKMISPSAGKFLQELLRQLEVLIQQKNLSLGFPLECRVKAWKSIVEKLERKSLEIKNITDIADLIGMRMTFLFQRDATAACELVRQDFRVLNEENTLKRLDESQFGYSSIHFLVELKPEWLNLPTLKVVGNFKAEIQVRTVAQHIWAAASHLLQYKQEDSVPPPIRRSIHRVSALLETVDLEFERVLQERKGYLEQPKTDSAHNVLNVDLLAEVLSRLLPEKNKADQEPYADLLQDLSKFSITEMKQLEELISKQTAGSLMADSERVTMLKAANSSVGSSAERTEKGVFFTHVGLVRNMLSDQFKEKWQQYQLQQYTTRIGQQTGVS